MPHDSRVVPNLVKQRERGRVYNLTTNILVTARRDFAVARGVKPSVQGRREILTMRRREKLNVYKQVEVVEDTRETANERKNAARNLRFGIKLGRPSLYYSGREEANLGAH